MFSLPVSVASTLPGKKWVRKNPSGTAAILPCGPRLPGCAPGNCPGLSNNRRLEWLISFGSDFDDCNPYPCRVVKTNSQRKGPRGTLDSSEGYDEKDEKDDYRAGFQSTLL